MRCLAPHMHRPFHRLQEEENGLKAWCLMFVGTLPQQVITTEAEDE